MSKSKQDGRDSINQAPLLFIYGNKRILGLRRDSYNLTIEACRTLFPSIPPNHKISLHTDDLDMYPGEFVEISAETWPSVISGLIRVTVLTEPPQEPGKSPGTSGAAPSTDSWVYLNFEVEGSDLSVLQLVNTLEKLDNTLYYVLKSYGLTKSALSQWGFTHNSGKTLCCLRHTIADLGFKTDDTIFCYEKRIPLVGKPFLYLWSPEPIEATVNLALTTNWSFSAIYPVVPTKSGLGNTKEHIVWKVLTQPNGDLKELTTGWDVSYLFWEAQVKPKPLDSPPPSPRPELLSQKRITFDPGYPVLNDNNAVLMPVKSITPYLDACLTVLGLHTETRTSFIIYWLHAMLKHEYVALRFLPQVEFEKSAPLTVSPSPDVVTRIFMLFRGVKHDELYAWGYALERTKEPVSYWVDEVGINVERTLDEQLFRVIEWGGMELVDSQTSLTH